ncbi:MAG: outer membrane protein assembly factor BamD [Candidatus Omnitrophica bacterium]|nr:outer membrane protein assembly factor BamD [Candidatus Omnitrophota bacterium]MCF7893948.1 outer membrane protein assembly factor BamD [Candidatus Omnitrophota bacterium]
MIRLILLVIFTCICFDAYPFWIWSPKTQKWKNPEYSALATPTLQYKEAIKYFKKGEFKRAYKEFKKLLVNYPDSKEGPEAQYYLGRTLEELDKPYEAYLAFKKVIQSYPNSKRINEIVEREYNIGEYFLNRENKKLLGISIYDFVNHPSVQIFQSIVEETPYSEYASRAQYKLGVIFLQLSRFKEAREAFQKVIDDYPDSRWATPAKYQLALATAQAFPGADYDASYLKKATQRLDEFIKEHPEAKISKKAKGQLAKLRSKEAKKVFEIALFYKKQKKPQSAKIYLEKIINKYPDTPYYQKAKQVLKELGGLSKSK